MVLRVRLPLLVQEVRQDHCKGPIAKVLNSWTHHLPKTKDEWGYQTLLTRTALPHSSQMMDMGPVCIISLRDDDFFRKCRLTPSKPSCIQPLKHSHHSKIMFLVTQ